MVQGDQLQCTAHTWLSPRHVLVAAEKGKVNDNDKDDGDDDDFESWWYVIIGIMLRFNGEDPQILLFEDAELKTTYNMEDLTRQGKGGIIILIIIIIIIIISTASS